MKIAYLVGRYPSVTHTFILREIRALQRLGLDVHRFSIWPTADRELLSTVDHEEWRETEALLATTPACGLRSHLRAGASAPRAYLALLTRAFSLSSPGIRGRAMAAAWFIEAILLWDACRRRGVRHIHVHLDGTAPMVALLAIEFANSGRASPDPWSFSQTVHGSKEFYDIHRERLGVKAAGATFIACISDYTRSQVMAFVPEELWPKLVVVRCGVDLHEFAPRGPGSDRELRILTVGRVDAMKGTVVLLQALQRLGERGLRPTLTIVGDGPSKAKAVAMAARLGVADLVRWEGAVGQDRIRDYYAGADVFCLPSFAEGVPIVLMEAMAMEVPVVANAITGIVELVEDGVSGFLVRPGHVDELTERLAQLLEDSALRQSMGQAGRARVQAEYDLDRNVRRLAGIFAGGASAAQEPPGGASSDQDPPGGGGGAALPAPADSAPVAPGLAR
jgi:glycosyltransferase involved in cell wall biosynthesis